MIELPAALAPWAEHLARLPTELALTIAPWVGRLAVAVGPMAGLHTERAGEPDGYAGLARRGSYERLVIGEWAIADLYPDEFVRRAAAGEHLFLELARRGPRSALWSIAIISAGPDQLGAPRLAHLAALVVLSRRAAAAGCMFSWGVLEDPQLVLIDGVDEGGLRRLLAARTACPGGEAARAAWRKALARDDDVEHWWIGGKALADPREACLIVRDVLEPDVRALDIAVLRRGTSAHVRLDLPTDEVCARLLRDPLGHGTSRRAHGSGGPAVGLRFAARGLRLLVERASGAFEMWTIPNSRRAQVGKPRVWTPGPRSKLIAIGCERRSVLSVTLDPTDREVRLAFRRGGQHVANVQLPEIVRSTLRAWITDGFYGAIGNCGLVRLRARAPADLVIELAGHLLVVPEPENQRAGHDAVAMWLSGGGAPASATVLGAALGHDDVQWAERRVDGTVHVLRATVDGTRELQRLSPPPQHRTAGAASFGFDEEAGAQVSWAPTLVSWGDGAFTLAAEREPPVTLIRDRAVLGVGRWQPGLLATLATSPELALHWETSTEPVALPTARDRIAAVAVCPRRPLVAWLTSEGAVVVYSMRQGVLLQIAPGGAT